MKIKAFKSVKVEEITKKKPKNKVKPVKNYEKPQEGLFVKLAKPVEDDDNPKKFTRSTLKTKNNTIKAAKNSFSDDITKIDADADIKANVESDIILQALKVLRKLAQISDKKRNVLFDEAKPIALQIECIKIPDCVSRKLRFTLPHWLVTDTSEVCLFVADLKKGSRRDHEPTIHHYEDFLKEKGISCIKTVIPMRQVRVEYDQMEMKRRLLTQYDFFLADARISGLLAHKLGVTFSRKNQMPTPIKIDSANLKDTIEKALHKSVMKLHGTGHTYSLHVANGKHSDEEACENIQAVLLQLAKQFPGFWENIRAVHVKHPLSMAIPIYMTLKNKNTVEKTVIQPLLPATEMVEDELTTILGAKVKVYPGGRVKVRVDKSELDEESDQPQQPKSKKNRNKKSAKTEDVAVSQPKKRKTSNNSESIELAETPKCELNGNSFNSTLSEEAESQISNEDEESDDESNIDVSVNDDEVNEESDGTEDIEDSDEEDDDDESASE
ncbi:uncharacterized protein LOC143920723 [Arctopsyche grandis]|uniref:uncharacterized protein LOC143920723 n=1 Tax=Arctopsyche grandis TaxID=121162 RepID=UPI00406D9513